MLEQPGRTQIRSENFTAKRPGIAGWQPTLCSRAANQHPPGILQRFPKEDRVTEIVNMHKAKTTLSHLVGRALAGEEVIIARNGTPLVRLVPVPQNPEKRVPGRSKGKLWISPDFELTDEEIDEFER